MCWTKHVVPRVARTGLGLRGREGCVTDSETLEPGLALSGELGALRGEAGGADMTVLPEASFESDPVCLCAVSMFVTCFFVFVL